MPILHDEENRHKKKKRFAAQVHPARERPCPIFPAWIYCKGTRQQDEIVSATTLMAAPPLSKPRQLGCCPKRQDLSYTQRNMLYTILWALHGHCLTFRATAGFGIGPIWFDRS